MDGRPFPFFVWLLICYPFLVKIRDLRRFVVAFVEYEAMPERKIVALLQRIVASLWIIP